MTAVNVFQIGVSNGSRMVDQIKSDEWGNDTPCTEWDLRALLNHMVYELLWVPELLEGKTIAQIGDKYEGDVLGTDPIAAWHQAVRDASAAVAKVDLAAIVHLSYGDVSADHYVMEVGTDIYIHSWDVSQAIKVDYPWDDTVSEEVFQAFEPRAREMADSGVYGKRVQVGDDVSLTTKLLALFGRKG